jgi:ESCRT-I complex subunit TSG101
MGYIHNSHFPLSDLQKHAKHESPHFIGGFFGGVEFFDWFTGNRKKIQLMNPNDFQQQLNQICDQVKYTYVQRVKQDVNYLVQSHQTLTPKLGTLTLDNGKRSNLLNLNGTVPMWYRNQQYNIPVQIWIVEMYPHHSPMVYVVPAPNMMIKPQHKHVDSSGRCYLPYLSEWNNKTSDIVGLVNTLSTIFSNEPPVFEKTQQTVTQSFNSQQNTTQQNVYQNTQTSNTTPTNRSFFGIGNLLQSGPSSEELLNAKVRTKVELIQREISGKMEEGLILQSKLMNHSKALDDGMTQDRIENEQLMNGIKVLRQKESETIQWLKDNEDKQFDIDKVVNATDEQSQQILELMSQDHAMEDAMYYLDKQLEKGGIAVDVYLGQLRELSNKQFLNKALLKKISLLTMQK